jgi:hypothetical protein
MNKDNFNKQSVLTSLKDDSGSDNDEEVVQPLTVDELADHISDLSLNDLALFCHKLKDICLKRADFPYKIRFSDKKKTSKSKTRKYVKNVTRDNIPTIYSKRDNVPNIYDYNKPVNNKQNWSDVKTTKKISISKSRTYLVNGKNMSIAQIVQSFRNGISVPGWGWNKSSQKVFRKKTKRGMTIVQRQSVNAVARAKIALKEALGKANIAYHYFYQNKEAAFCYYKLFIARQFRDYVKEADNPMEIGKFRAINRSSLIKTFEQKYKFVSGSFANFLKNGGNCPIPRLDKKSEKKNKEDPYSKVADEKLTYKGVSKPTKGKGDKSKVPSKNSKVGTTRKMVPKKKSGKKKPLKKDEKKIN